MNALVNTKMGTFLERVVERLELPRGTRLGVRVSGRQIRTDRRFEREKLPKVEDTYFPDEVTLEAALDELVRPRLPVGMRKRAKFVVFRPKERGSVQANVRLSTVRNWGDRHTEQDGRRFDKAVNKAVSKLAPIWHETVEDLGEDEIFLRAVCYFYSHQERMQEIIRQHFISGETNIGGYHSLS